MRCRAFVFSIFISMFQQSFCAEPLSDPLWDGHESVAEYASRAHLEPTKTLDLGNGVTLDLVLIPAGRFIMGTPEPEKPTIAILVFYSAQVLLGIGAVLMLALLVSMILKKRPSGDFSFSRRWLLTFTVLSVVMVWGGTRWYLARVQILDYKTALLRYYTDTMQDEPAHPVLISKAFYMGKFPVTNAQYEAVIGNDPSFFNSSQNPVESVSWDDATMFCKKLNEQLRAQTETVNLPTEAQWEYACRAGTKTRFYSGDADSDLDSVAWYGLNSGNTTHPVGGKKANAFGLYDMHGNTWQWCQDTYREDYEKSNAADPINDIQGAARVVRGGSWNDRAARCRSAYRSNFAPVGRFYLIGFRVVVAVPSSRTPH